MTNDDSSVKTDLAALKAELQAARQRWEQAGALSFPEQVAGRRVVVSADGGRIRIRKQRIGKFLPPRIELLFVNPFSENLFLIAVCICVRSAGCRAGY